MSDEPDDEGGRNDPMSRRSMYERVVNMDRLVKRMVGLINEMHPKAFEHEAKIRTLEAKIAQQGRELQELRATVGQLQARTFDGSATSGG